MTALWPSIDFSEPVDSPLSIFEQAGDELSSMTGDALTLIGKSEATGSGVRYVGTILARANGYRYPLFQAEYQLADPYPVTVDTDLFPQSREAHTAENLRVILQQLFADKRTVNVVKQLREMNK